jgi:membrane protease YdiL (CAAX protease family)
VSPASPVCVPGQEARNGPRANWIARHRIAVFVGLAFALSWWPWPLALAHPDSVAMVSFGPVIAAFAVTALGGGHGAARSLARAVVQWRAPRSTWVVAALGPFAIAGLTGIIAVAAGIVTPPDVDGALGWSTWLTVPLLMLVTGLLGGPLFEEVGWRGFLLPDLQRRRSALWSTAIVGSLWVTWHLPLLVSEPTGQRPALPFAVGVLGQAVLLTWLYNSSGGSVLVAIVFHTAANTAGRLLLEPFLGEAGFLGMWWLMASLYVIAAAAVIWRTEGRLGLRPVGD